VNRPRQNYLGNEQIEAEKLVRPLKQTLLQNDLRKQETDIETENRQMGNVFVMKLLVLKKHPRKDWSALLLINFFISFISLKKLSRKLH